MDDDIGTQAIFSDEDPATQRASCAGSDAESTSAEPLIDPQPLGDAELDTQPIEPTQGIIELDTQPVRSSPTIGPSTSDRADSDE
eukprot:9772187-Heterocapsa_arctica.AAC.1